jgi:hypothetical protein
MLAALRSQADFQRLVAEQSVRVFASRDLAEFASFQRMRDAEQPRIDSLRAQVANLARRQERWKEDDLASFANSLAGFSSWDSGGPIAMAPGALARLICDALSGDPPGAELQSALMSLAGRLDRSGPAEARRAAAVIARAASGSEGGPSDSPSGLIDDEDDWGAAAREALRERGSAAAAWLPVLLHARTATASKPSRRWLATAGEAVEALPQPGFTPLAACLLGALSVRGDGGMRRGIGIGAFAGLDHLPKAVPTDGNAILLRGVVWTCAVAGGEEVAGLVAAAARECSRKLPDVGARSPKVFNACLFALAAMPDEVGAEHLLALQQKVRKPSARKQVDAAVDRLAAAAGVSREALADASVPSFGLHDGPVLLTVGTAVCELSVEPPGRVAQVWRSDSGAARRPPRTVPKVIGEVRAALATQRRRMERALASGASWPWGRYRDAVLAHPITGSIASGLVVEVEGVGSWLPADPAPPAVTDDAVVRLWHPASKPVEQVVEWRRELERRHVVQPFKQAHREVYLLTPAEREAEVHSPRFAGHVVRQHALRALCEERGWTFRLLGPFDPGGGPAVPTLELPDHGLIAELDVAAIEDPGLQSGHGIFLYVLTGSVRFRRAAAKPVTAAPRSARGLTAFLAQLSALVPEPVRLEDVPSLIFSEVLRDVDLFISVAGVAADPTWGDTAPARLAQYWHEHAFAELTPLGERRREVLERVLPALAIADRVSLEDRFVVVRGRLRTYRIHLGTANVLMEPGSRHLCIVPRGGGGVPGEPGHVWLPFEGDGTLAVILSKVLMLADDEGITDPHIMVQIRAG